jgi:hypothetical protein
MVQVIPCRVTLALSLPCSIWSIARLTFTTLLTRVDALSLTRFDRMGRVAPIFGSWYPMAVETEAPVDPLMVSNQFPSRACVPSWINTPQVARMISHSESSHENREQTSFVELSSPSTSSTLTDRNSYSNGNQLVKKYNAFRYKLSGKNSSFKFDAGYWQ